MEQTCYIRRKRKGLFVIYGVIYLVMGYTLETSTAAKRNTTVFFNTILEAANCSSLIILLRLYNLHDKSFGSLA